MYIKMNIYMLLISKLKEKGHRTPQIFQTISKSWAQMELEKQRKKLTFLFISGKFSATTYSENW